MKLGMFMMPLHPPQRKPAETYAEDREAVLLADRLGYCEALVGEHVTDLAENVTSCLMFLASLAHDTKNIVLGSGTINMPNPHPPIVVTAVAPHSKGVTEAAKRGWNPISANFLLPQWVASHWPRYQEGCKAVQKEAQASDWRVAKSIFVADDDKVAKRYGHGPEGPYHFYFKQLIRKLVGFGGRSNLFKLDQSEPDSSITADTMTPKLVLAGTVGSVVDQILAFRETTGDFGTLYYACHDWVDPALGRRSMQLMAEQVMPRVNAAIAKSGFKVA